MKKSQIRHQANTDRPVSDTQEALPAGASRCVTGGSAGLCYPLGEIMSLLGSGLCKQSVGSLIMDLVESVLDFSSSNVSDTTAATLMETDQPQVDQGQLEIGETVAVDESGMMYISQRFNSSTLHLHHAHLSSPDRYLYTACMLTLGFVCILALFPNFLSPISHSSPSLLPLSCSPPSLLLFSLLPLSLLPLSPSSLAYITIRIMYDTFYSV